MLFCLFSLSIGKLIFISLLSRGISGFSFGSGPPPEVIFLCLLFFPFELLIELK